MATERLVEPDPKMSFYKSKVLVNPRSARLYNMLAPITPPPMITASAVVLYVVIFILYSVKCVVLIRTDSYLSCP